MTEQQKQAERKRLHDLLFADATDWADCVMKTFLGFWSYSCAKNTRCKAQPETALHFTDSLIRRGEYE